MIACCCLGLGEAAGLLLVSLAAMLGGRRRKVDDAEGDE